ncbi:carboxylate--amine ligase [Methylobacterium sp. WSM2598]|uniref:carboxylate--amine ligase n=1 Tax=Methylobacterium sp. WSM2598 TaxID=398261 RepID=UPI001AEC61CB|nr:hypothetical protein [Methylobacterium sp. WSM2598]
MAPALWSRHALPIVSGNMSGEGFVETLLGLGKSFSEPPVLFNTDEMSVLPISRSRDRLASAFKFRLPDHEILCTLQDKARFHEFAVSRGLPVPGTALIRREAEIRELGRLRYPVVVKAANKGAVHAGKMPGLIGCACEAEAASVCGRYLEDSEGLVVQEWIDGAVDEIFFCLFYCGSPGDATAMFTGRKLASTPRFGLTAYCQAAPEAAGLLEPLTRNFIECAKYVGLGSVEYKWDRSRSKFLIVEPTVGRTDMQEEIATLSGVNIPLIAYRYERGEAAHVRGAVSSGVVWRSSWLEPLRGVKAKIPHQAVVYDGFWRRDDPLPGFARYGFNLCSSLLKKARNVRMLTRNS